MSDELAKAQAVLEAAQNEVAAAKALIERLETEDYNRPVHQAMHAHEEALADAAGLRRELLRLHAPVLAEFDDRGRKYLVCNHCFDELSFVLREFPCPTYKLALDWKGADD